VVEIVVGLIIKTPQPLLNLGVPPIDSVEDGHCGKQQLDGKPWQKQLYA
tara:strand:+ start:114 stop:260 length:147 start_codon:yes stop_codon:yes gene_type:complete